MAYKYNILLGEITKTSGFEGAVLVKLEKKFIENIPSPESVFLEIEGRPVPFFISSLEYSGSDMLRLTFEGYESVAKVSEFKGCRVFLTSISEEEENHENLQIEGYTVCNSDGKPIGKINEVIENPGNLLLSIVSAGKKILVPLHEDLIVKIDKRKKIIFMEIPEGLTDIN
jgi:16S rRNA processing protein RimM